MLKDFKQFLEEKFGFDIVTQLMDNDGKIILDNQCPAPKGENEVATQMAILANMGIIQPAELQIFNNWALDFPGWVGNFNQKDIMIIGLEPHIQNYDYQVTYNLGQQKNGAIVANHFIWERLYSLFAMQNETPEEFYKRLYITDLCHFAPRGNANNISKIPNWKSIRENVAKKFLKREIAFVSPKIIIAQGTETYKHLKKELKISFTPYLISTDFKKPKNYAINIGKFNEILVIGVPHLGSDFNMTNSFWNKKLAAVKKIINEQ